MLKITPPKKELTLKGITVFKCDTSKNAFCGILWVDSKSKEYFEFTHGKVGDVIEALEIVNLCRAKSLHALVSGKLGVNTYRNFIERYRQLRLIHREPR